MKIAILFHTIQFVWELKVGHRRTTVSVKDVEDLNGTFSNPTAINEGHGADNTMVYVSVRQLQIFTAPTSVLPMVRTSIVPTSQLHDIDIGLHVC